MAFCSNCGNQLSEQDNFCSNCGSPVSGKGQHKRTTVYEGELHKCPNCGDIIDAYETICDACGYEIRGRHITSVVHELALKLQKTNDPKKKDELIRTFYIPNTREDIYEFVILATSNIKIGGMNTNAWMVKLDQAYQKAELYFANTEEFNRLKTMYLQAQKMNKKNSTFSFLRGTSRHFKSGYTWALLFCLIGLIFVLLTIPFDIEIFGYIGSCSFGVAMWIAIFAFVKNS